VGAGKLPCVKKRRTRRTRGGDALLHRCGGGLNRPPIGNHQIEDFDGGLVTLGAYRPGRGAWDTESSASGVSPRPVRHPVENRERDAPTTIFLPRITNEKDY